MNTKGGCEHHEAARDHGVGVGLMSYDRFFADAIAQLRDERRNRVFADLERIAGRFPHAIWHSAQGHSDLVLQRLSRHGARPEGDPRNARDRDPHGPALRAIFPGPITRWSSSSRSSPTSTAKRRRCGTIKDVDWRGVPTPIGQLSY